MRLAMIVPVFPQVSETFIVNKAVGLARRGVDVRVVCGTSPEAGWRSYPADHPVHRLRPSVLAAAGSTRRDAARGLARNLLAAARDDRNAAAALVRSTLAGPDRGRLFLEAALLRADADVVHFEFGTLARTHVHLRSVLQRPVTVSFRGYDLAFAGLEDPEHYAEVWRTVDRAHFLGHDLWRRAQRRGAPDDLPRSFISPAIDPARFSGGDRPNVPGLGTPTRPLRLVSVGRLHWKKGYEYGLDAVALLRGRGIEVEHRIVGDGPMVEAIGFWRHQLGLDDAVVLVREAAPSEVVGHLHWADVFLHPAVSEGFGNAVLEAQAAGLPVVCTDADGLAENVEDGVTGLVVPRRDGAALGEAIARLVADAPLRAAMSAAGPERVRSTFDLETHLDRWEAFYAAARAGPPTAEL